MKLIITNIDESNKLEVLKKIEERYPDVRWYGNIMPTEMKSCYPLKEIAFNKKWWLDWSATDWYFIDTEEFKENTSITAQELPQRRTQRLWTK